MSKKKVISPLEAVLKIFFRLCDPYRDDTQGVQFNRKDDIMTATACNGYIAAQATYSDNGPDIKTALLPTALDIVRVLNTQDFELLEKYAKAPISEKDWTSVINEDKQPPLKDNHFYFDMALFSTIIPKSAHRVSASLDIYKNIAIVEYEYNLVKFKFMIMGLREI